MCDMKGRGDVDLTWLFFDEDRSTWAGDLSKGGKAGQDGLRFGLDLCPPAMAALSPVCSVRKSNAHSGAKSPRSLAPSHDGGSELTFDNWISTDVCSDTWTGLSIATTDFDSIAAPVSTQECLWRIFESDMSTEEIEQVEPAKVPTPAAPCKNTIMGIFRKKLNIQKALRPFACFNGGAVKRRTAAEVEKTIASCNAKTHSVPAAKVSKKSQKQHLGHITGRFPVRKKGQGHSCGVKE